jgi:hypothetical protein
MADFVSRRGCLLSAIALAATPLLPAAESNEPHSNPWHSDYFAAREVAETERKSLLIHFSSDSPGKNELALGELLASESFIQSLGQYVCLRLPLAAEIEKEGKQQRLLKHSAFAEMQNSPGLAILDFSNRESASFATLVTAYPLRAERKLDEAGLRVLLDLPPGSLTQRTMVFAVRTHCDSPRSTSGQWSNTLANFATSHSAHQARIRLQGHHNWSTRFYQINAKLLGGLLAQEVCAESWPGQSLVDAAIECVHSWRQSPGHWSAVSKSQPLYAYDMKRGSNGVWYATGIFGNRGS